jgi:hypothetical protein
VITYLLGGAVVVFLVLLVYGGLAGRVRLQSGCCCPADPDKDFRMRTDDEESNTPQGR